MILMGIMIFYILSRKIKFWGLDFLIYCGVVYFGSGIFFIIWIVCFISLDEFEMLSSILCVNIMNFCFIV